MNKKKKACSHSKEVKSYIKEFKKYSFVNYSLEILKSKWVPQFVRYVRIFTWLYDNIYQIVLNKVGMIYSSFNVREHERQFAQFEISKDDTFTRSLIISLLNKLSDMKLIVNKREMKEIVPDFAFYLVFVFSGFVRHYKGNIELIEEAKWNQELYYKQQILGQFKTLFNVSTTDYDGVRLSVFMDFDISTFGYNLESTIRVALTNSNILKDYYLLTLYLWCSQNYVVDSLYPRFKLQSNEEYENRLNFLRNYQQYIHYNLYSEKHAQKRVDQERKPLITLNFNISDIKHHTNRGGEITLFQVGIAPRYISYMDLKKNVELIDLLLSSNGKGEYCSLGKRMIV